MTFLDRTEFLAALGLAAARVPQALHARLDATAAELEAARAREAQLQIRVRQAEVERHELLDAVEALEDRAIGAEARASAAEYEVRRLGRVLAEFQAQIAAMAQAAGQGGRQ